jgi:hypothetical protein
MAMQPAEGGLCEYHSLERNGTCHHGERKINNMHEPTRRSWWRSTPALRQRPLLGALRLQAMSAALRQRQRYGGALPLQPAAVVDEQAGDLRRQRVPRPAQRLQCRDKRQLLVRRPLRGRTTCCSLAELIATESSLPCPLPLLYTVKRKHVFLVIHVHILKT